MRYLEISNKKEVKLSNPNLIKERDDFLFKKGVVLIDKKDSISLKIKGRQLGIVFVRHGWSGYVDITVNNTVYQQNLYSPYRSDWIYELVLPPQRHETTIIIKPSGFFDQQSKSGEVIIQAVYVSDYLTCEIVDLIRERVINPPLRDCQINQLVDTFKWYDSEWFYYLGALKSSPDYSPPFFVHRKAWEWGQCVYGLKRLCCLEPENRALGVGVGWEPLSYYFSNIVKEVIATDLYEPNSQWSESSAMEGNPDIIDNPDKYAPFPYRKDRLKFMSMDGKKLNFPDNSFDFVWSCSSIEHFGKHLGATQAMKEIERVLKPEGVAAVITEYVLPNPDDHSISLFDSEFFNLRYLYNYLIRPLKELRLVQMIDFSIPDYYVRHSCKLPDESGAPHHGAYKPHVVLRSPSGAYFTSISLFFRKEIK